MLQTEISDTAVLHRMKWRCRRGLLELDIVLERFVGCYGTLDTQQKMVFDILLDMPDTQLWDMIGGKLPAADEDQRKLLAMINAA